MKKRLWAGVGLSLCAALWAAVPRNGIAQQAPASKPAGTDKAAVDAPFKNFTLRNMNVEAGGKGNISLASFKGKKTVVAIFMANRCGTTWTYEEKIGKLLKDYKNKDVEILAIHTNYNETDQEILAQFEQRNLAMPVLDDKKAQAMGQYVGAVCTPTFLVIDKSGVLRYRGSFDKASDDSVAYVRPALEAVLAGKPVAVKTTRAFG